MKNNLALAFLALSPAAFSQQPQEEGVRGCRAFAVLSTSVYYNDVFVNRAGGQRGGNNRGGGNLQMSWEAWVDNNRAITGTCEADPRGTIVRFERLAEKTGAKPPSNASGGFDAPQGGFGRQGGNYRNNGRNQPGMATLDNNGRGNFSGFGMNTSLDHAHVVLQDGRATATLSGGQNRVTLLGQVTRQISDREYEISIDNSDRGNTTGTMQLRMTPGANEAEEIVVRGGSGRQAFNGRFNK